MLPPIYPTLSAWPAVSAIVGTRIYPHADAPQEQASAANPRQALYDKAKQYQTDHPGTDLMDAIAAVSH